MSGHVLDIGPILKTVALILLAHICIHMRLDEYFLHLIGKGDHKAPRTELIVTFLSSWSFVVQYNIVLRLMLEGINVSIWLKCEELSGSDDQLSIVSHVEEVKLGGDLHTKQESRATQWFCPFWMHKQQVVFAYLGDDESMSCLNVSCVVPLVVTDKLRASLAGHRQMVLDIVQTSMRILLVSVKQIEPLIGSLNPQCSFRPLLPDQILLKSQQRALVSGMLAYLNENIPVMRCEVLLALVTLCILFHKLYNLTLLYPCGLVDDPHKIYLDLDSLRMRFSPYKLGILELQFRQSFDLLQQNPKQFWTLSFAVDPGRSFVPEAVGAKELFFIG